MQEETFYIDIRAYYPNAGFFYGTETEFKNSVFCILYNEENGFTGYLAYNMKTKKPAFYLRKKGKLVSDKYDTEDELLDTLKLFSEHKITPFAFFA